MSSCNSTLYPEEFLEIISEDLNSTNCDLDNITDCLDACQKEECVVALGGDAGSSLVYKITIQILVFFLVFGLAGSVDFDHFKERFKSKGVYIGLACQFILMPLIGFATVAVFNNTLDPLYAISLIIICASPGGSYSNWWCNLINADLALSVAMTTVSTVVSCGVLPLNIFLYVEKGYKALNADKSEEILQLLPYEVLAYTLANVIIAVITGLIFGYKFPQYMKPFNLFGTCAGFLSILLGVVASGDSCADPFGQPFLVYFAILVPVVLGLFSAMALATCAGLPKPQRVAVSIETAYQNTGIALAVTLSLGSEGRAAAIVPLVYGGYEAVCFGAYAIFAWYIGWTLSPPDESLWVIMYKSYQDQIDTHPHYANKGVTPEKDSATVAAASSQEDLDA
mmetsp:Transcript_65345/g.143274  ORF Transcript_65345/g.143274 Transcript_65345/m.143274 type:complete len:396 (+) Transcript_65345:78-1265(+)